MPEKRTSPWTIAFRAIFTIALFACVIFIFRNSLQNSADSSLRSQSVMAHLNAMLGHLHLGPLSEHIVRKLAHFSEYMLEGFLLMLCLRVYTNRFVRYVSWPLLGGMATALMDETLQIWSPGRSSQVSDVWIDMAGVVSGLLIALVALLILRGVTSFYEVKRENRRLRAEHEKLLAQQRAQQERNDGGKEG